MKRCTFIAVYWENVESGLHRVQKYFVFSLEDHQECWVCVTGR